LKPDIYNPKRLRRSTSLSFARFTLAILALCIWAAFSLLSLGGISASASAPLELKAQATGSPAVPNPVETKTLPKPQQTNQPTVPGAAATARAGTTKPRGGTTTSQGDFPWLPVIVVGLGALALAGFVLMRPRPTAPATKVVKSTAASSVRVADVRPDGEDVSTATTTTTTAAHSTPVAAPPLPFIAPTQAAPTSVTCPNCETLNEIRENFCHACGQDLRPTRAALMAAVAPPPTDVVTDDMPYLETLDRTDEQLEYVLSRPRVTLGTASNSDIVIDAAFNNWQTVSPTHAEVRRGEAGHLLIDRDSKSGTFVNDAQVTEHTLADGDTLRMGDVRFIFHIPGPDEA
jgi:hypothetical protein